MGPNAGLSPSSKRSLEVQGGPFIPAEVAAFEAQPHWEAAVRLRRWDDRAKRPGVVTSHFDEFANHVRRTVRV